MVEKLGRMQQHCSLPIELPRGRAFPFQSFIFELALALIDDLRLNQTGEGATLIARSNERGKSDATRQCGSCDVMIWQGFLQRGS